MSEREPEQIGPGCGEDAAPYVLGALGEDERAAFLVHLDSCAICRDEVTALEGVVAVLPAAVAQLSAPPELKGRVMATVRSEAALRGTGQRAAGRTRAPIRRTGRRGILFPAGALTAAVLAVVLIVSGGSGGGTRVIRAQVAVPRAEVSLTLSGGHAELNLARMPPAPPNHVYEVWVKRGGAPQPTDALFTVTSAGSATVGVPGSLSGVKQILVTAEPAGGSRAPTATPVIVADLS